jgi:hypothetical protein
MILDSSRHGLQMPNQEHPCNNDRYLDGLADEIRKFTLAKSFVPPSSRSESLEVDVTEGEPAKPAWIDEKLVHVTQHRYRSALERVRSLRLELLLAEALLESWKDLTKLKPTLEACRQKSPHSGPVEMLFYTNGGLKALAALILATVNDKKFFDEFRELSPKTQKDLIVETSKKPCREYLQEWITAFDNSSRTMFTHLLFFG